VALQFTVGIQRQSEKRSKNRPHPNQCGSRLFKLGMGSDAPGKRELPSELFPRARLFCDLLSQSVQIGEFQHVRDEIDAGVLAVTAIGDVIEKRAPGRRFDDEITIFDSSGISLQDLYMADALIRAKASHR
jgi:ornithine cyclodeaminase/alanine dehydrogenase-like protein (mu-crystallin family)